MNCKKCSKELIFENELFKASLCEGCDVIEIFHNHLWHKCLLPIPEIDDLYKYNYTMNYIVFNKLSSLYNLKADQYFIDLVNGIEKWYDERI